MAISWTDVVGIAPELASVPVASQAKILSIVERQVDDETWGDFADDGKTYLAAHYAAIRDNTSMVTSESLGPMSRSYAAGNAGGNDDGALGQSTYGSEYLRLMRLAVPIAIIVP